MDIERNECAGLSKLKHLDLSNAVEYRQVTYAAGSFSDVFRGRCKIAGGEVTVAVKRLRINKLDSSGMKVSK